MNLRKQAEALAKVADDYAADYCSGVDIPDNAEMLTSIADGIEPVLDWIFEQLRPVAPVSTCDWEADSEGVYATQCGRDFEFTDGDAEENDAKFCQYCGRKINDINMEVDR